MLGQTSLTHLLAAGLLTTGAIAQIPNAPSQPPENNLPSPPNGKNGECSDIWYPIGKELIKLFITEEGICSPLARQAIRLPFHDCFPDGGCDGSIILTDECTARRDNFQMIPSCGVLYRMFLEYRVGAADLINFAAAIANKICPYGPFIPFFVGRQDNPTAAPTGQIPSPFSPIPDLVSQFAARGFSVEDLVAFVGAHSVGSNLSGVPFDTTPGIMDGSNFYTEVLTGAAPVSLASDIGLSTNPISSSEFQEYARSQNTWIEDYVAAMIKMILRENDPEYLVDCTEIIFNIFDHHEDYDNHKKNYCNKYDKYDDEYKKYCDGYKDHDDYKRDCDKYDKYDDYYKKYCDEYEDHDSYKECDKYDKYDDYYKKYCEEYEDHHDHEDYKRYCDKYDKYDDYYKKYCDEYDEDDSYKDCDKYDEYDDYYKKYCDGYDHDDEEYCDEYGEDCYDDGYGYHGKDRYHTSPYHDDDDDYYYGRKHKHEHGGHDASEAEL